MAAAALLVLALPGVARADRPDTPGTTEIFRYDASDVVEHHDSPGGSFRVHFTRAGSNSVPLFDGDGSGVPDHVERVAAIYDEVLAFYRDELGYRAPLGDGAIADGGGDGRFDVYLLDFGGRADGSFRSDACGPAAAAGASAGQCVGFMVQENDFAGYGYPSVEYANRLLASHELFHAVQAAYDSTEGSVLSEGTAVWASEAFDPTLQDLEHFAHGYLDNTDRPIDRPLPGPVDPFSYGSAIFFRFLEERFGRDVIRELIEATETDDWLPALDGILMTAHGSSFADAFRELVVWDLRTADRADPSSAYANGADYPLVRIDPIELPYRGEALRVFYASAQYRGASPGARTSVGAALVGDAAGLELVVAVRRGSAIEIAASGAMVSTTDADEVIVVVVSPAYEGESRRPGLCVGSAAELAACRRSFEPTPDGGAGDADAGTTPATDAGSAGGGDGGGCACAAPGAGPRSRDRRSPIGAAIALAAVVLARAVRRRTIGRARGDVADRARASRLAHIR